MPRMLHCPLNPLLERDFCQHETKNTALKAALAQSWANSCSFLPALFAEFLSDNKTPRNFQEN